MLDMTPLSFDAAPMAENSHVITLNAGRLHQQKVDLTQQPLYLGTLVGYPADELVEPLLDRIAAETVNDGYLIQECPEALLRTLRRRCERLYPGWRLATKAAGAITPDGIEGDGLTRIYTMVEK